MFKQCVVCSLLIVLLGIGAVTAQTDDPTMDYFLIQAGLSADQLDGFLNGLAASKDNPSEMTMLLSDYGLTASTAARLVTNLVQADYTDRLAAVGLEEETLLACQVALDYLIMEAALIAANLRPETFEMILPFATHPADLQAELGLRGLDKAAFAHVLHLAQRNRIWSEAVLAAGVTEKTIADLLAGGDLETVLRGYGLTPEALTVALYEVSNGSAHVSLSISDLNQVVQLLADDPAFTAMMNESGLEINTVNANLQHLEVTNMLLSHGLTPDEATEIILQLAQGGSDEVASLLREVGIDGLPTLEYLP